MSLIFYSEEGENQKEESIDKYKDLFDEYKSQSITLTEALIHMYTSSGVEKNKMNVLITDLIKDCKNKIELNLDKIKEKYPSITEDEAIIISSYTCEAEDNDYSPYKLLNKNLVSDDRINGIKKISKYFYILLKSLRKLKKYYPTKENKYLYRCIGVKVNYKIDPFDKKSVPYIDGNTKTFWSFTSTSTCIKTSYKFLKGKKIQSGTIFTLYGDIWGYDISLFNVFNEEEILLEPERKFIVDQVYPPVNDIIHVRCNIQKTNPVLSTETTLDKIIQILAQNNNNIDFRKIFKELFISEHFVDIKGTKNRGWNQNIRKRGGEDYIPPSNEWIGIGLNVKDKYDNGNNTWLGNENKSGEFAVAYIGLNESKILSQINKNLNFENISLFCNVKDIKNKGILNSNFGKNCGKGVLIFQNPKYAENYASLLNINGVQIKALIMCRVNPKKIRQPEIFKKCWILNSNSEEIRPYRILIKIINISSSPNLENNNYFGISNSPREYILDAIKSNDFSFNSHNTQYYALKKYINENMDYRILNTYLIHKEIIVKKYSEAELKSWICCLHNEIKNNDNVKDGTIVYRSLSNIKFPSEIGIGSKFYLREFVSTSLNKNIAEAFSKQNGTLLTIIILNNGTNCFPNYCCNTQEFSPYKNEEEVIITTHCSFMVTDIAHIGDKDYINLICGGFLFD